MLSQQNDKNKKLHESNFNKNGSPANELKERLKEGEKIVKNKSAGILKNANNEIKQQATETSELLNSYIKNKPFLSLGIATAVGAGLALLLSR